ncbi:T9SS type A sorting domain-containing protein [Rufibacter hautae]|nr:T9SS type A sorting domain-containing protein [Rufibacter hautae]
MTDSTKYRVYANASLVKEGKVKLQKGASTTLEMPSQVVTYRLEADQVPHHPGQSRPTVSLQPTSIPTNLPSMAMPMPIDDFYQDDADAEVDIYCLEIVDSFDPNDKQVSPRGISSRHYIKAEDELEYLIRFQNTGTDVAYNVVVKDTISEHLDIASLRVGSGSHPFTYTVTGRGKPVITFTFKNINLPDHKTNEPGSHGFVKFSIAQNPDNPKGTVIKNTAHNYFDYNSPIATNEVTNIIGDTVLVSPVAVAVTDCGVEEPTVAQAGSTISLCETSSAVLNGNQPIKGTGRWKVVSGQAFIVDSENPGSAVQALGYGETVLEWTVSLCKKTSTSQVKIFRYQVPTAPFIAEVPLQCEGDALRPLVATGTNITWYSDAVKKHKLSTGNEFTPSVTSSTTFFATQNINGCEGPAKAVEVKIQPKKIEIVAKGDTLVAPPADSYQWYFNDEPMPHAKGQKLIVKNSGLYKAKVVTNGCESISENLEHTIHLPAAELKVQPNPVSEALSLTYASNATGQVQLIVRSHLGIQVMHFSAEKSLTVLEKNLIVSSLVPGMYVLEVRLGREVQRYKFIKL